ncbi:MAG: hypothetical protein C3F13_13170 [Anaerolineales bacterium]|nr:hypothetical protein [Anaerolineae bacterium]PWB51389.1 MAG: hypothetical protein C3F13_13170 [Anaerolineales bacterium]
MKSISLTNTMVDANERTFPRLVATLQSTLLVFFLFFPVTFIQLFLHEGGHALVHLIEGYPVQFLYAHPFSFIGYVRPGGDYYNIWSHASGTIFEILVSAAIFILLWKWRSFYTLPLLLVFPWIALYDGLGGLLSGPGDDYNLLRITGWSPIPFYAIDLILIVVGIFFLSSLFPLLSLKPEDRKSLFVLPAGMLLYSAVGLLIALALVPGSPIDVQFDVGQEIIMSARYRPIFMGSIGLLLALIYGSLYRVTYKRLPAMLRTEGLCLCWRDLIYPGVLFIISLVLGLIVIL